MLTLRSPLIALSFLVMLSPCAVTTVYANQEENKTVAQGQPEVKDKDAKINKELKKKLKELKKRNKNLSVSGANFLLTAILALYGCVGLGMLAYLYHSKCQNLIEKLRDIDIKKLGELVNLKGEKLSTFQRILDRIVSSTGNVLNSPYTHWYTLVG